MIVRSNLNLARVGLAAALFVALGVAGCGRKAGLDPPPATQLAEPATAAQPGTAPGVAPAPAPDPGIQPFTKQKLFFMDWLLN